MARVFLSHAAEDTEVARTVGGWLRDDGHDVFLDRDPVGGIVAGEDWEDRLHERLRWADAVVCLVTTAYVASHWCTAEVSVARSRGSLVLPIQVEAGVVHPLLKAVHYSVLQDGVETVRSAVRAALDRLDTTGGVGWTDGLSPFPGLLPFDADQRRAFFGRTDEVGQLVAILRSPAERADRAVLLVVGPSGCGKSSLVRAGLQPVMAEDPDWRTLRAMTPGTRPTTALAAELAAAGRAAGLDWTVTGVLDTMEDGDGLTVLVDELLLAPPGRRRRRLLVVVDQFEELMTQSSAGERARFTALLRPVLGRSTQIVATMRAEFLDQLLADPELAGLPKRTCTLQPLTLEAVRSVIEGPARLAGFSITDDLIARMVHDTATGEALPLLAYTLAQLADGVARGGALSAVRYRELGGVHGTLSRQADAALAEAVDTGGRDVQDVISSLLRVVTVDELNRPTRWRVDRGELPEATAVELEAFVARRLLVVDADHGRVTIAVAHEAFLSRWPPLADAIAAHASALRMRSSVEQSAAEWVAVGRPSVRLWEGGQLAAALSVMDVQIGWASRFWVRPALRVPERAGLGATALDFLVASVRRDLLRRGRATAILSVLLTIAVVAAGTALQLKNTAQQQQRTTVAQKLLAQAKTLRNADPLTALRLNLAANSIHSDPETRGDLLDELTRNHYTDRLATDSVTRSIAFTGNYLIAGGDNDSVMVWDNGDPSSSRQPVPAVPGHHGGITALAVSRDGDLMATAGLDRTLVLWDLRTDRGPQPTAVRSSDQNGSIASMAFAPDGHTLATASADTTVVVWDVHDGVDLTRRTTLTRHRSPVTSVAFAPDGHTLATAGDDSATLQWDLTDPAAPQRIGPPLREQTTVTAIAYSPTAALVATASGDGAARLWDVSDRAQPRLIGAPLTGHAQLASSIAFSSDGGLLAIGSADATTSVWDVSVPAEPRRLDPPLAGHDGGVVAVAFGTKDRVLATAGADRTIVLWNLGDPGHPRQLGPADGAAGVVNAVAFAGSALASTTAHGAISIWDRRDLAAQPTTVPTGRGEAVNALAADERRRILASGDNGGNIVLWDVTDPAHPRSVGSMPGAHPSPIWGASFSADGTVLATVGVDGILRLWDVTDPGAPRLAAASPNQGNWLVSAAISPDRTRLATGGVDGSLTLWDITNTADPRRLGAVTRARAVAVNSVSFAPNGEVLAATGDDGSVALWGVDDLADPRPVGLIIGGHAGAANGVTFIPGTDIMVTAGQDGAALLWDVEAPATPRRMDQALIHPSGPLRAVAVAPDGGSAATGGVAGTTTVWDLSRLKRIRADPVGFGCQVAGRDLDTTERQRYVQGIEYQDPCRP